MTINYFPIWFVVYSCLIYYGLSLPYPDITELRTSYWLSSGQERLTKALNSLAEQGLKPGGQFSNNLILFVGDGMGTPVVTAARVYRGQTNNWKHEQQPFTFEQLPFSGISMTYDATHTVSDSASSMTAMAAGVKVQQGTIGVGTEVKKNDCDASKDKHLENIAQWAISQGKSVGFVTNTRVTHATPAAFYAHSPNRDWENDEMMERYANSTNSSSILGCKDIARQLIEDFPAKDFTVMLGGGYLNFVGWDKDGLRKDGRDLIEEWKSMDKTKQRTFVTDAQELKNVSPASTHQLFGIFDVGHLPYASANNNNEIPTLREMTDKAIDLLQMNKNGYLLLVEGGRIDHALHDTRFKVAAEEVIAFDDAVDVASRRVDKKDTTIIVTADHSHVLNIMGYTPRDVSILGSYMEPEVTDNLPLPVLVFADGNSSTLLNKTTGRRDLTNYNTDALDFRQASFIPRLYESHGGEDVAIYAGGPGAALFTGVLNSHDIAHAIAYTLCMGPHRDTCLQHKQQAQQQQTQMTPGTQETSNVLVAVLVLTIICILLTLLTLATILTKNRKLHFRGQKVADAHFPEERRNTNSNV